MTKYLYHYTRLEGLEGILESNSLWATSVWNTNDESEIVLGCELLKKSLIEKGCNECDVTKLIQDHCFENALKKHVKGVFLTCFSGHDDDYSIKNGLLSQWRGYGSYAIRFDKEKLENFIKKSNGSNDFWQIADFDDVVGYFDKNGVGEVHGFADKFKDEIEFLKKIIDQKSNHELASDEDLYWKQVFENVFKCFFLTKHIGFKEEKERRVLTVVWNNIDTADSDKTKVSKPRVHIELFKGSILTSIDKIIIGPVCKEAKNNAEKFLKKENIKHSFSETPFLNTEKDK